jgi:mono/diheme cytochrome c family protein
MRRVWTRPLAAAGLLVAGSLAFHFARSTAVKARSANHANLFATLHAARLAPSDLEVGGELVGERPGTTRYVSRNDLLALPQVNYAVTDDSNFKSPTQVSGVLLDQLSRSLNAAPGSDLVVALCNDRYCAYFPRAYLAQHHPLLVLKVNGQSPSAWPKDADGEERGPYMISHPNFTPSFKVMSNDEEPQIPWGVVRLEFRNEKAVLGAIAPRGVRAAAPLVLAGYGIAQQSCFHCHNMGPEGGQKSGIPWEVLSALATTSPEYFAAYVRNPQAKDPHAQMPGYPGYDDRTLSALTAYFQTFSLRDKP